MKLGTQYYGNVMEFYPLMNCHHLYLRMRAIFCSVFLFLALPVWPSFGEDVTGIYFSGGLAFQKQLMLDLSVIRMTLGYGSHSSAAPGVTGS